MFVMFNIKNILINNALVRNNYNRIKSVKY